MLKSTLLSFILLINKLLYYNIIYILYKFEISAQTFLQRVIIIIYPSVGKYCFPNRDSSRQFLARTRYDRVLK